MTEVKMIKFLMPLFEERITRLIEGRWIFPILAAMTAATIAIVYKIARGSGFDWTSAIMFSILMIGITIWLDERKRDKGEHE